jgi:hypothetical protein
MYVVAADAPFTVAMVWGLNPLPEITTCEVANALTALGVTCPICGTGLTTVTVDCATRALADVDAVSRLEITTGPAGGTVGAV